MKSPLTKIIQKEIDECIIKTPESIQVFVRDYIQLTYPLLRKYVTNVDFSAEIQGEDDNWWDYNYIFIIPNEIDEKFMELYPEEFI